MAKKLYEESSIQDIASAIRAKNGSSDTYTVAQMSTAIADIPTGGGGDIYKYHWSNDGKICVREEVGAVKWFFIGLTKDSDDIEVPTELVSYLPDFEAPGQYMHAIAFTDPEGAWDKLHYIGFVYPGTANVKIRSWYSTSLGGGTFWGVLDITHYPFIGQQNEYVDPLDIPDIDTSLIEKTITENGTYSAEDDGYVGYLNVDVNVEGGGSSRIIDMNNVDASVQGSMKYVDCLDSISTLYSTGDAIGCSIHCTDAIDVTNADKIVFRLKTGPCYGHNNANVEQQTTERFKALVGIVSSWTGITYLVDAASSLLASKKFDYTNTVYTSTDCYLDVSSITGDVYIGIDAHGWNATLEEIRLE